MRVPSGPRVRWGAAAAVALLAAGAAAAVLLGSSESEPAALPSLVDVSPAEVQRLVVEAGGRQAELTRAGLSWSSVSGTPPQSAPLLESTEARLFPLLAYRVLNADPADPQYGLVDPAALVRLDDGAGRETSVRFGAANFSGAGFYARHDSRPDRLYLVPRNTVDLLRSLTTGERITSADPLGDQAGRYRAEREKVAQENEVPVYLRQVIESGGETPPPAP
jgi:hypothetical protein